jgi:LPXTG-motif cell wall-anchored protein
MQARLQNNTGTDADSLTVLMGLMLFAMAGIMYLQINE